MSTVDWPNPASPESDVWAEDPQLGGFKAPSGANVDFRDRIAANTHGSGGADCVHRGKRLPPFFRFCPRCGAPGQAQRLDGFWLPPFGWSPANGVSRSEQYRAANVPVVNHELPAFTERGPLRWWIAPPASGEPSDLYLYRPSNPSLWRVRTHEAGHEVLALEIDAQALDWLRDRELLPSWAWAPVWFGNALHIPSSHGLLRLRPQDDAMVVERVSESQCLGSPCVFMGQLVWIEESLAGPVLVRLDAVGAAPTRIEWSSGACTVTGAGFGLPWFSSGTDLFWVHRQGVVQVDPGFKATWRMANPAATLVPRAMPDLLNPGEPRFFTIVTDFDAERAAYLPMRVLEQLSIDSEAISAGSRLADRMCFRPSGDGQSVWFSNGASQDRAKQRSALNLDAIESYKSYLFGTVRFDDAKEMSVSAEFGSGMPPTRAGYGRDQSAGAVAVDRICFTNIQPRYELRRERGALDYTSLTNASMPFDWMLLPYSANNFFIYFGDRDGVLTAIDLSDVRPI